MTTQQEYLRSRPGVHSTRPWAQFRYVASRLEALVLALSETALAQGARVLDYGCASQPYRGLFEPQCEYVGADLQGNDRATIYLNPNGSLPVEAGTFDLVISTQVLEHVTDPSGYLSECHRVLRSSGSLVLTTHGIMYYHRDPEDYWRWTCDGLSKLVTDAGFEVTQVRGIMGLASVAIQLFQDGTLHRIPRLFRSTYILAMQLLIAIVDRGYSDASRVQNSLVIGIRAVKP